MRFLTYNLWHGLSPTSPVVFQALEPAGRRELRELRQYELLQELKPDVFFFQECNPVLKRRGEFEKHLGMSTTIQPDLVGLKLFGLGLPLNLNSGLVIGARSSFMLRKVAGVSLSRPGVNLVHSWGSWQLKEERFALFSEAMIPGWGRVLLINTHLHHGLEATPEFFKKLERLIEELELSPKIQTEVKARLAVGSERRRHEMQTLLEMLKTLERRYEVVILGGDFNASPESDLGQLLQEAGFSDMWSQAHPEGGGLSFDATKNEANHFLQNSFPLTLVVEDLSFSAKVKDALLSLARAQENRPRRIDYLWMRSHSLKLQVKSASLEGLPDSEGFAPSDHFAVCADLELA